MTRENSIASLPHRLLLAACTLAACIVPSLANPAKPVARDHYIDVRTYADYNRRPWPMPGWHTFGDRVQLVGNRYVNAANIAQGGGTGRVYRPNYDLVRNPSAESFSSLLSQLNVADPALFVWNLGGYIPDSHPGGFVKYDYLGQMIDTLGERFLGSDIGEQDGRYHNVYKSLNRLTADPFEEYLKLHRFQLRVAEDHADKASLLTVMYNWHGTLRDGLVVSAAAECQNKGGVTNPQVQYAFLRGAARQFGVSLAGDLAVFTSWDTQRTSTALRRRYLFSEYQWNCAILSCEDAYEPAPIVRDFNNWMNGFLDQHPRPGPVQCPVAFLTDPFQGWIPGMALSGQFKKHVSQAYQQGDFLTHLLFDTVYPRYADNGMWKDESRAMAPTPYGDLVEVVTSDCPAPVMDGYGVMILASDLPTAGRELRDKLEVYAGNGGHVVVTAANAKRLWPEWGIGVQPVTVPANSQVNLASGGSFVETLSFDVLPVDPGGITGAVVSATSGGVPLVVEVPRGEGRVTLLASAYGLNRDPSPVVSRPYPLWNQTLDSSTELVQPHVFPEHVRRTMDGALKSQQLFSVGNDQLAFITNRVDANNWLVGIYSSQLTAQSFQLQSQIGAIQSVVELPLDNLAASYPFLPPGYSGDGVPSDASRVAAGDVRFLKVSVDAGTAVRVTAAPTFPALPSGRFLRMPTLADLDRSLIRWPTFFQHFDGVMIDWTEIRDIDPDALKYDLCRWMNRQRLRFVIDCRNEQAAALDEIAAMKDTLLLLDGARDLLFSSDNPGQVARINAMAADPAMNGFHFRMLPSTQQGILRDPVNLPGIEILDLIHDDWEAVYANVRAVFGSGSTAPVAGTPVDRTTVSGTTSPLRSNLFLSLRDPGSVERALKKFDPVWKNFAGVKLESDLVWRMSEGACTRLGQAMQQRGLKVIVDYSDHLQGWTGVTFQNLDASLRSPEIGAHVRSERVFANIAAKLPLLGSRDVLIVESMATDLVDEALTGDPQVAANRAVLEGFCQRLRDGGVTVHLWHRPYRGLTSTQARALIDSIPGMKAAMNLNANPNIAAGRSWAGSKLGMAVIGAGTTALAQRNAIPTSSKVNVLMYAPLSLASPSLAGLPEDIPWVLDGDYQNPADVAADLGILPPTASFQMNGSVTPSPVLRNQMATIQATVVPGTAPITSVVADASALGGSATLALTPGDGGVYSAQLTLGAVIPAGQKAVFLTATDASGASKTITVPITVAALDVSWDNGAATGNWNSSDANWTGAAWNNTTLDSAVFGTTGIGTVTLTEAITAGNITFNNPGYTIAGGTLSLSNSTINVAEGATISSVLAGTTGMTKAGAGILSLTGVSTYSGGTTINDGTLSLESATTDTSVRGTVTVNSGGTLRIAGANWGGFGTNSGRKIDTLNVTGGTVNNTLTTSFIKDATINMTGGTISGGEINWRNTAFNSLACATTATVSSRIMIRPDYGSPTLAINVADGTAATDLLISGVVKQSIPSGNLVKTGAGTLELSAQNTYTGNTTVEAGTLRLQLPKLADTSTLSIGTTAGPPAVLDLPNSGTDVVAALIINGSTKSAGVYDSSNSGGAITGNGSIEASSGPAYLVWAATKGLGGSGGKDPSPAADPDGDGAINLAEFALNGDPLDGSSTGYMDTRTGIIPSLGLGLILTFATRAGADFTGGSTANKDGVTYTVEGSIDLNNFTSPVTEVTPAIVPAGWPATGDYEYHSFRLNASTGLTGKGFLRVTTNQ
jgi:autotransporter-associated beta strand protein